jgi:hypothetical protein
MKVSADDGSDIQALRQQQLLLSWDQCWWVRAGHQGSSAAKFIRYMA